MQQLQFPCKALLPAALCALAAVTSACAEDPAHDAGAPAPTAPGCLATGDGQLEAALRGALVADLSWNNSQMQCDGSLRDDGALRVTIAGPLVLQTPPSPESKTAPARLRFIFGIDPHDTATGVAQAFPVNLTVIVEGDQQLYATRGNDKCAAESLLREPVPGAGNLQRIRIRGYCVGPASDIAGSKRLLVPTFSFTALIHNGVDP
jgi:hypothetical protein